jgi:hypothetical protein
MKRPGEAPRLWIQDEPLAAMRLRRLRRELAMLVDIFKAEQYSHDEILTALQATVADHVASRDQPTIE